MVHKKEKDMYLVGPRAPEKRMRIVRIQVNGLVERRDCFFVQALTLQYFRQRETQHVCVVFFVGPMRASTFLQAVSRGVGLLRLDLGLRKEEQLRAQRHIVGNELSHVWSQASL